MRKYDVEYGSNTSIQENEFAEGRIPGENGAGERKGNPWQNVLWL